MPSPRAVIVAALLVTSAVAAACAPARVETAATPLAGSNWKLAELGGTPAVGGADSERATQIRFHPDSGRIYGSGGCNRIAGPYTVAGDSLSFGPIMSTKMACLDDQANRQEVAFLSALDSTRRYRISGDTLTLIGTGGPLALLVATDGA
ncbi:MAG: META domain-containing protein [Gemmatimonadaceae bacterium]